MESFLYITAAAFAVGIAIRIAIWVTRVVWRRRDAERHVAGRQAYQQRREADRLERAQAAVRQLVDRFFPFAKTAWVACEGPRSPKERLRRVLANTDGIKLGTADIGFDAVLPESARVQHLICLAKTGYGKTTIAIRMIWHDLRRGLALCILAFEAELFRDQVMPLVPADRVRDVIYFKPADPACTLTWNPLDLEDGEDQALAAGQLFSIFKQAVGETTIGVRADAILSSAFSILVGRPGSTLWSVVRLLEDERYRAEVVAGVEDPYLKDFWTKTFPEYPAGAAIPLANRLNQFLRRPQIRAALCHPVSSFSIRRALASGSGLLFFDLSGLDPDAARLLGRMLLSKFQVELMRRERIAKEARRPVNVYLDEFHMVAGSAEGTWRELLARGRRYGLGLHLFTQHPNQLPRSLQHEIFGNVSSLIAMNLSATDAATVRRELLVPVDGGTVKPVPAEQFVSLPVGEGFARLGSGACALRVRFAPPIEIPPATVGNAVREQSWKTFAAPPMPKKEDISKDRRPALATAARDHKVETSSPGRGGPQHKMLQQLARQWGEERGFRANLEEDILGGAGRVDVVLVRGDERIAIEVSVTSSPAEVAETVGKCVASGFDHVVVVANDENDLGRAEQSTFEMIPAKDKTRVRFVLPDGLRSFLDQLSPGAGAQDLTAGYTVRVEVPTAREIRHRHALARLVGATLLRPRPLS